MIRQMPARTMFKMPDYLLLNQNALHTDILSLHLLVDEQSSHSLSCPDAHASDQDLLLRPPCLTEDCANLSCAGSSKRVSKSDGATSRIHFGVVQAEDVQAVDGHGGESLIDLEDIDIVLSETKLAEEFGNGD